MKTLLDNTNFLKIVTHNIASFLTYLFHFRVNIVSLGGTIQRGNWNTEVDDDDKKRIWDGCLSLMPSLKVIQNEKEDFIVLFYVLLFCVSKSMEASCLYRELNSHYGCFNK